MSTSAPSPTRPPETNFGTVTSWIPLTTTFPSQSGCSSDIYARFGIESGYNAVAFDPAYGISVNTAVSCLPAEATTWWLQLGVQNTKSTVVSLGPVVCPAEYTTIGTSSVGVGTTLVACCPIGYDFVSIFGVGLIGECTSSIAKGAIYTYAMLSTPSNQFGGVITTSVTLTSQTYIVGVPINGYIFAVASTTSSSIASSTSSTSSTPSTPSASSTLSTALASPTSTPIPDSGLSVGAKAGIGIGVGIAVLALVLYILFVLRRIHRKNQTATENTQYKGAALDPMQSVESMYRSQELHAHSPFQGEMEGDSRLVHELDARHSREP